MTRFIHFLCTVAQISAVQLAHAEVCPVDPSHPADRKQWCGCPTSSSETGKASVIDLSQKTDDALLAAAKAKGIRVVIRYYDWTHTPTKTVKLERDELWRAISSTCQMEATCDKVVTKEEIDRIHHFDLKVAVVFQHFSHDWDTWLDKMRPAYDAKRAIELAQALGQPQHSTIFFGVDGADDNFLSHGDTNAGMGYIKNYFHVVTDLVTKAGYNVGVYGSGLSCDKLTGEGAGLPHACWLSMSTGHPNSQEREASGKWAIKQCAERKNFLGTTSEVDPDILNDPNANLGQW